MREESFQLRVKIICSCAWGIPPWEFDEAVKSEKVSLEDVRETLLYTMSIPFLGENIRPYLFRERIIKKQEKLRRIKELVFLLKKETDPEKKEKLKQEIDLINHVRTNSKTSG